VDGKEGPFRRNSDKYRGPERSLRPLPRVPDDGREEGRKEGREEGGIVRLHEKKQRGVTPLLVFSYKINISFLLQLKTKVVFKWPTRPPRPHINS